MHDVTDWRADRRARTRHLIELGGLVLKAGLVDRVEDDRATLLGAFLHVAGLLDGDGDADPAAFRTRCRRRGLRAFEADRLTITPPSSNLRTPEKDQE